MITRETDREIIHTSLTWKANLHTIATEKIMALRFDRQAKNILYFNDFHR